ncbi:hypothetical protein B1A87_004150 [Arthrobacter sp. KBS0703]|uniref:DUF6731 family protein n=1 Tax=Arthrobacter sp. KBS0703 TaxID=1955698 RepID=UPI001116F5AD|nr:DUF6731 family protein [Arthrobacter sp. KBS0703]TSE15234.1 hypothetical protein B1A87_004150 [Arthrobacter sp. KBS0703]
MSKKRTVYFMEVFQETADGVAVALAPGFWDLLASHLRGAPEEERSAFYRGNLLLGEARSDVKTLLDYIYLGRSRPEIDWPDVQDELGSVGALSEVPNIYGLLEPVYIAGIDGSNFAAFLRSSGGPTWSGIEAWINEVTAVGVKGPFYKLRPLVKKDGFERLRDSFGVSKVHIKVEPHALGAGSSSGAIGQAMEAVEEVSGDLSMELILSFGHATPDTLAAEELKDQLVEFMRNATFKKSSATLIVDQDGETKREQVDFLNDKITSREVIDAPEGEEPSLNSALIALGSAIQKYRQGKL